MFKTLLGFLCLLIVTQLLQGCTALTRITATQSWTAPGQNQRIGEARHHLKELAEIDSLIKLDNKWLASQFGAAIETQAAGTDHLVFRKLSFRFSSQFISLDAIVDISDQSGNRISAAVTGDVNLAFASDNLRWFPRIGEMQIKSKDFTFEGVDYSSGTPNLQSSLLRNLNTEIIDSLVENGSNAIAFDALPLGEIQVGARLPGLSTSSARHTESLRGVLMMAGSAHLVEKASTTVALDLTFKPGISECPSDVTVTRAEFARDIKSREPVDIADGSASAGDIRYFFSEISGARESMTVIHYWFADGLPLAVEELPVEPSRRWRTWSDNGSAHSEGTRLEVLVVEKESGCILLSKSIRTLEPEPVHFSDDGAQTKHLFTQYQDEFTDRISGFSIGEDKPELALIETRRVFLRDVLQASLRNLSMTAEFDESEFSDQRFTARLQPFDPEQVICKHRDCHPAPVCKINISHCKRYRDTRDCMSCLFRNPLNNRCVSEASDPLCEAARKDQNDRYEAERSGCIARAEESKEECDQLNAQALRSCQIESGFAGSACESVRSGLIDIGPGVPLATVSAQAETSGRLRVNFSNFRLEGDLERLKLDMSLITDLQFNGDLNFSPGDIERSLAQCIADWSAPFNSRFTATPEVSNLLSNLEETRDTLIAPWSGFGLTIETGQSPLEARLVGDPRLLAKCRIGLTVSHVEGAMTGKDRGFYQGQIELEIQPLPTRIHLAPAWAGSDGRMYSAEAELSSSHLLYAISER